MQRILIGDVGSTKGHWAWLEKDRQVTFRTTGYNPVQHHEDLLRDMLGEVRQKCTVQPDGIYYYGSGVVSEEIQKRVISSIRKVFGGVDVHCESDMLGAARSVCPGTPGIVCILGTGSNSCVFDGQQIVKQIPSLGFPLGDEGSGADIGRACVRAYYYGLMPEEIGRDYDLLLPRSRRTFISQYHEHPAPNRLLSGLAAGLENHRGHPFVREVLRECFRTFARLHILPYQVDYPVYGTGGIAKRFQDAFKDVLEEYTLTCKMITGTPLPGLIAFHQSENYG